MEHVMTLRVQVGEALPVGSVAQGELNIIPITGGAFEGPRLRGRVLPGGADWNTRVTPEISHVCARYWIQTEDGAMISVYNKGWLDLRNNPDTLWTTPRFQCDLHGPYAFLNTGCYAGTLRGQDEHWVEIGVWRLNE